MEGQYFMYFLVPLNQITWFLGLWDKPPGTSSWLDVSHVPEQVVLMQVRKDLTEGLTLPLGHQLHEALAGLGSLGFLLY